MQEIKNLLPGQTIKGQVTSKDGNNILLALPGNIVVQAKLNGNLNILLGQTMNFEVLSNNGSQLSLSPLYANMANEQTIVKALQAAGLPDQALNRNMIAAMMEEGMSIDRESVLTMSRQILTAGQHSPQTIVQMTRLQLPITENMIEQYESYQNNTHKILDGVIDISEQMQAVFEELLSEGNKEQAFTLLQSLHSVFADNTVQYDADVSLNSVEIQQNVTEDIPEQGVDILQQSADEVIDETLQSEIPKPYNNTENSSDVRNAEGLLIDLNEKDNTAIKDRNIVITDLQGAELQSKSSENAERDTDIFTFDKMERILKKPWSKIEKSDLEDLRAFVEEGIRQKWTISPKDIAKPEKIEALYERIREQSARLEEILQEVGKGDSHVARSVQNIRNNIDFLNQINQTFSYIQLPLKMIGNEAHGDLYVYTNKKNLAKQDGNVSALLHLDMEHLGGMDVYVTMQQNHVNTNFKLQDEQALMLIAEHIDTLEERLVKRGYSLNAHFEKKEEYTETESIMQEILNQDKNISIVSCNSFDMRA